MDYYDGNECRDTAVRLGLHNCAFRFTAWAYIWRAGRKPGQDGKEDIRKACNYIRWLRDFPTVLTPFMESTAKSFMMTLSTSVKNRLGDYRIELLCKVASVVEDETALVLELLAAKFDLAGNILKGDL